MYYFSFIRELLVQYKIKHFLNNEYNPLRITLLTHNSWIKTSQHLNQELSSIGHKQSKTSDPKLNSTANPPSQTHLQARLGRKIEKPYLRNFRNSPESSAGPRSNSTLKLSLSLLSHSGSLSKTLGIASSQSDSLSLSSDSRIAASAAPRLWRARPRVLPRQR